VHNPIEEKVLMQIKQIPGILQARVLSPLN